MTQYVFVSGEDRDLDDRATQRSFMLALLNELATMNEHLKNINSNIADLDNS